MRRITADLLAAKGACPDQLDKFRERWPDGLDVETVMPGEVAGLSVGWAVRALLPAPAWEAWKEAEAAAWKAYAEATTTAREAFVEATAPARRAYEGTQRSSWEAFKEAKDTARKACEEAKVRAWGTYEEAAARAAIAVFREYWQEEESHDE